MPVTSLRSCGTADRDEVAGAGREMLATTDDRGARVGTQTTRATMLLDLPGRQGDRAAVVATVTSVGDPGGRGRWPGSAGPPAGARCHAGTARRPRRGCRPGPAARWPARPGLLAGHAPERRRRRSGRAARGAGPRPSSASSAARLRGGAQPSGRPRPSARAASTRRSLIGLRRWRARPGSGGGGPPSSGRCPERSCISETGNTTSARSVTAEARVSRLITKSISSRPSRAAPGSRKSLGSTPATISAASSSSPAAAGSRRRRDPAAVGSVSIPQVAATSIRAAGSATGRPPGSRLGRQPASTAPRSPARRGTQASRAPVRSASRRHGGQGAGGQRGPLPDQDHRIGIRARDRSAARPAQPPRLPDGRRSGWRPILWAPVLRYGASVATGRPCLRNALRSRRKTAPASSSGSKHDQQHRRRPDSRSAKVTPCRPASDRCRPPRRPGTRPPRRCAGGSGSRCCWCRARRGRTWRSAYASSRVSRPPVSTPTRLPGSRHPDLRRRIDAARCRPRTATSRASGQDAGRSTDSPVSRRSRGPAGGSAGRRRARRRRRTGPCR